VLSAQPFGGLSVFGKFRDGDGGRQDRAGSLRMRRAGNGRLACPAHAAMGELIADVLRALPAVA